MTTDTLHLVCYQPDIALNVGALIRLCACADLHLHVIDPCGFPFSPDAFRRSALDYSEHVHITRHIDADTFFTYCASHHMRPVLLTTKTNNNLYDMDFIAGDALIFGRESAGVPADFAERCALRYRIPMAKNVRSMNIVTSAAVATGEAIRQVRYARHQKT